MTYAVTVTFASREELLAYLQPAVIPGAGPDPIAVGDDAEAPKRRGRPRKEVETVPVAEPAVVAPVVHTPSPRTPLTQAQSAELIATFIALGKSGGGQGRELIGQVLTELGVNTVVAITGEQFDKAITRAKELTK